MTPHRDILDAYTRPGAMTALGPYASMIDDLPADVGAVAAVVQGLIVHPYLAKAYATEMPEERRAESHVRPVPRMLARLFEHDERPLSVCRPPAERFAGVCRHFEVLAIAILRAKGVPVRARCGFATYLDPGRFTDHWVSEYWSVQDARWIRVDAQIDDVQRELYDPDFDPLDVPHDRFLTAAEAWTRCRGGNDDPEAFGIFDTRGLWFIAGNVIRDVAALNHMEMLPWDVWGGMPAADERLSDDRLAFFDRLAALASTPDSALDELRALYASDERLRVPGRVFNALLRRQEAL